jgi:hypothetical protein
MSTTAVPKKAPESAKSDHTNNIDLIRRMGGTKGYDPMPPDQHAWPMKFGGTHVQMLWSWMCANTIARGRRSPYAVDEKGHDRHIEHAAADLNLDLANARRAWRTGCDMGLWKNGNVKDCKAKRRLYFSGEVKPKSNELDEPETNDGRTNGEKSLYRPFSPYIRQQILRLTSLKRRALLDRLQQEEVLQNRVIADFTEAVRTIFDQRQDTLFDQYRVKKIRINRKPDPKREARDQRIRSLVPVVERFVQTSFAFEAKEDCTSSPDGHVQTCVSSFTSSENYQREAGGHISDIENQKTAPVQNGRPARPPAKIPNSDEPESDILTDTLISCGFAHLEPAEVDQVRVALGKTGLRLFDGILRDRLTRGRIGLPVLVELAKKAQQTERRLDRRHAPRPPSEEYQRSAPPDEDPVISTQQCGKCGGKLETLKSGRVLPCACALRERSHAARI